MWWTKIERDGRLDIERHRTKLDAGIAMNFAHHMGLVPHEAMGLYRVDPSARPTAENLLPAELERARRRLARRKTTGD